jgi:hypothetical protein
MIGLGITASGRHRLTAVPARQRRQSRTATLAAFVAFVLVVSVAGALGVPDEQMWGGRHLALLGWATFESVLAVFGLVWLLGVAQRRLNRRHRRAGPAVGRSAYGAPSWCGACS